MLFDISQFASTFVSRRGGVWWWWGGSRSNVCVWIPAVAPDDSRLLLCEGFRRRCRCACPLRAIGPVWTPDGWEAKKSVFSSGQFSHLPFAVSVSLSVTLLPAVCIKTYLESTHFTPSYTSSPPPSLHCSPCGLGAYGFSGQQIRETCQPVVLSKHIF